MRSFPLDALGCFWWLPCVLLVGCGGGGGGGADAGSAFVISLEAAVTDPMGNPVVVELWSEQAGAPTSVTGVPLNAALTFRFAGPVDAGSLPLSGVATGSINITTNDGASLLPAQGSFTVVDDPALPSGNRRLVRFSPSITPQGGGSAVGYEPAATYSVFVPGVASGASVVTVGGVGLGNSIANVGFVTCDPQSQTQGNVGCFSDPTPGPAFLRPGGIVAGGGTPVAATESPGGAPVVPAAAFRDVTAGEDRVSLFFNEPLFPAGATTESVRIVNATTGAQVPGGVRFFQAGTTQAGAQGARLDYVAAEPFWPGVIYELILGPGLRDLGGNPVALAPPEGAPQRFFATTDEPRCAATPLAPPFTDPATFSETTGAIAFDPANGVLESVFPTELLGTGAFGPLDFVQGLQSIDTGIQPEPPGQVNGVIDATYVHVRVAASVRVFGPWPLFVRAAGEVPGFPGESIRIEGWMDGNAGSMPGAPYPETGSFSPNINGGQGLIPQVIPGGVGGVGAGDGGDASQFGLARTPRGGTGFGARIDGQPNPGPQNPHFGGGEGGQGGGRYPASGMPGELGGLGAAGGSAFTSGVRGGPYAMVPGCQPLTPTPQVPAVATGPTLAFTLPLSELSAGSGGGGGGDHFPFVGTDFQGASGAGGGGGMRLCGLRDVVVASGGTILCEGAAGAVGNVIYAGAGGGGSGGMIWLQSLSDVVLSTSAQLRVSQGLGAQNCSNHASGAGGVGVFQFEDADGLVNTSFAGSNILAGQNVGVTVLPLSGISSGLAVSPWLDSGYGDPRYPAPPAEAFTLGTAPGATLRFEYRGAHAAVTSTPNNVVPYEAQGPLAPTAWVRGDQIDQLAGRRFIQFRVITEIAAPPQTVSTMDLPRATGVIIPVEVPCSALGN